jgi:hypothetical protein
MKRGCLIFLFSFAACAGATYWYFAPLYPAPGNWIGALVCGAFGAFTVGSIQNFLMYRSDLSSLLHAGGRTFPKDGEKIVAAGMIQPLRGESLLSPFGNKSAVLCQYEAFQIESAPTDNNNGDVKNISFNGIHMIPSAINTGMGEIKLLCFPLLDGFSREILTDRVAIERARKYRENTKFEKVGLQDVFSHLKAFLSDDDGSIHYDWMHNDRAHIDQLTLAETLVPAGAQVVAFGVYSSQKGGIIPSLTSSTGICRLYQGTAQTVAPVIKRKVLGHLLGAIFCSSIALGLVSFILKQWQASLITDM